MKKKDSLLLSEIRNLKYVLDKKEPEKSENPMKLFSIELEHMIAEEFPELEVPKEYDELSYEDRCRWLLVAMVELKSVKVEKLFNKYVHEEHKKRVKHRQESGVSLNV